MSCVAAASFLVLFAGPWGAVVPLPAWRDSARGLRAADGGGSLVAVRNCFSALRAAAGGRLARIRFGKAARAVVRWKAVARVSQALAKEKLLHLFVNLFTLGPRLKKLSARLLRTGRLGAPELEVLQWCAPVVIGASGFAAR